MLVRLVREVEDAGRSELGGETLGMGAVMGKKV